jgi:hypothetical protein
MQPATREPAARRTALQYELEVQDDGRLEFDVPLEAGTRVIVFVIVEAAFGFDDLLAASQSSLDFWDNPFDDEDWNNA